MYFSTEGICNYIKKTKDRGKIEMEITIIEMLDQIKTGESEFLVEAQLQVLKMKKVWTLLRPFLNQIYRSLSF